MTHFCLDNRLHFSPWGHLCGQLWELQSWNNKHAAHIPGGQQTNITASKHFGLEMRAIKSSLHLSHLCLLSWFSSHMILSNWMTFYDKITFTLSCFYTRRIDCHRTVIFSPRLSEGWVRVPTTHQPIYPVIIRQRNILLNKYNLCFIRH